MTPGSKIKDVFKKNYVSFGVSSVNGRKCKINGKIEQKQVWLQPYKAPCIVESGSYAITTVQSPNAAFLTFFQKFSKKQFDGQTYKKKIRY